MGKTRLQAANYEAEDRLGRRLQRASPLGERYLSKTGITLDEVRVYIYALQAEPWFRAAWPNESKPVTVKTSSASSSAHRPSRTLRSSTQHRKQRPVAELVLLHEMAHMITRHPSEGRKKHALDNRLSRGHTRQWRDAYVRLVRGAFSLASEETGRRWANRLRQELDHEPGICTCDNRVGPSCREFGAHPDPLAGRTVAAVAPARTYPPRAVAMLEHEGLALFPYQVTGAAFVVDHGRSIIGDDMGVGKTIQALAALETAQAYPALIVCPYQARGVWVGHIAEWLPHRVEDITVVHYDILHSWPVDELRGLVVDELHYAKDAEARRTQAVARVAALVPADGIITMLSGTPFINRPNELVEPLLMLGYLSPDRLAPNSAEAFLWRFCAKYELKMVTTTRHEDGEEYEDEAARLVTTFDGSRNAAALAAWLSKCMIRRLKKDVLPGLAPKTRRQITVNLNWQDKFAYEEMADEAAQEHDRGRQLVKLNLLRQLVGRAKIQHAVPWILDFCQSGKSLVVFADHIDVQHAILDSLRQNGIKTVALLGDTSVQAVEDAKAEFQAHRAQVIVCSLKAASISHTLTAASDVLFVEYGFTPAEHDQAEDRLDRIGQTKPVTCHYLSAAGTLDKWSYRLIEKKRRTFDSVLNDSIEGELLDELRRNIRDQENTRSRAGR